MKNEASSARWSSVLADFVGQAGIYDLTLDGPLRPRNSFPRYHIAPARHSSTSAAGSASSLTQPQTAGIKKSTIKPVKNTSARNMPFPNTRARLHAAILARESAPRGRGRAHGTGGPAQQNPTPDIFSSPTRAAAPELEPAMSSEVSHREQRILGDYREYPAAPRYDGSEHRQNWTPAVNTPRRRDPSAQTLEVAGSGVKMELAEDTLLNEALASPAQFNAYSSSGQTVMDDTDAAQLATPPSNRVIYNPPTNLTARIEQIQTQVSDGNDAMTGLSNQVIALRSEVEQLRSKVEGRGAVALTKVDDLVRENQELRVKLEKSEARIAALERYVFPDGFSPE